MAVPIDPDLDVGGRRVRARPDVLAAIGAGGAMGAPARYEMVRLVHVTKDTFPWATFWTNVSGSVVLGFLVIVIVQRFPPTRYLRPFVATGFLGAYTTFSTFTIETVTLAKNGHPAIGAVYLVASTIGGFVAAWIGIVAGRRAPGRRAPGRR